LEWWINESQRKIIRDRIDAAVAARMGAATSEGFKEAMEGYHRQLEGLDGRDRQAERVEEAWSALRARGRG
jgi:hypothetical protein